MASNPQAQEMHDYSLRGTCQQASESAVAADPTLRLVRGYYHCTLWGKQQHWWTERPAGAVYDPTAAQFPSAGAGEYEEFDGSMECSNCGKSIAEDEADIQGRYAFCSYHCHGAFVGVL